MKYHYYKTREEWLALRSSLECLGGSEIGAILGLNPYCSAYEVWARRMGLIAPKADNEAMRQGRDLEDYVAERFSERSGLSVHRVNAILTNDNTPRILASIDRKINNLEAGLECKTASALNAKMFKGGEFPAYYYCQCVTYLAITELDTWYLAVAILGREFKVYALTKKEDYIKPDWVDEVCFVSQDEIDALVKSASEWYENHIVGNNAPAVDGSDSVTKVLNEMYSESNPEEQVDLMPLDYNLRNYKLIKTQIDHLQVELDTIVQGIKDYMGTAEVGISDVAKVSWKTQERKTLDANAVKEAFGNIPDECYKHSSSRVFKLTLSKGA